MAESKKIDLSDLGATPVSSNKIDLSDLGGAPISTQHTENPITEEQIGGLEAGARGAAKGLSLGFSPRIIAGAQALGTPGSFADAYNRALAEQQQRESLSAQQHPIIYHGAEFGVPLAIPIAGALGAAGKLGVVGSALAEGAEAINLPGKLAEGVSSGIGALGEAAPALAETAAANPLLAKLGMGAAQGAAIGGAYGAGNTKDLTNPEALSDIASGMKTGAELGTAFSGLGAAAEGIAQKFSGSQGLAGDMSNLYLKGLSQQDLNDFDKISQQAMDYGQVTGNKLFQDNVKIIKAKFNALQEAGEMSGKKADITDIFATLNKMKQQASEMADTDAQKTVNQLINMFENKAYGLEQLVEKQQMVMTQKQVPGQKAIPSTQERLQAQADQLNSNAQETAQGLNQPADKYEMYTSPESGKMNIRKTIPGSADQEQQASFVNKDFETPTEGQPEIQPSTTTDVGYEPITVKERPGQFNEETGDLNTPELGMNQAVGIEKQLGGMKSQAFAQGNYNQGKIISDVDKLLTEKVSGPEGIMPQYAEPREQWKNMLAALDKAGINKDKMLDLNINEAGEDTINELKPEIMKKINDQILTSQEPGYSGKVAQENLDRFFNYLEKSGAKNVPEIRNTLEQNMQNYQLSQSMQPGSFHPGVASHNPAVSALSFLKSYGGKVVHNIGLIQGKPSVQQLATMAPGTLSQREGSSDPQNTPMENFSRNLSYANPEQAKSVSAKLKTNSNLQYLGEALDKAIESDNQIQKNAIIFAISQNPEARKLLNEGQK